MPQPLSSRETRRCGRPYATATRCATALLLWAVTANAACGGDDATEATPDEGPDVRPDTTQRGPTGSDAEARAALIARVADGDVAALLAVLRQPHATARLALGPHTLRWSARFQLEGTSARAASPALDTPVVDDRLIEDEGTLRWASAPSEPPRWALSQHNDHERGRDVIALDETMFVRMRHRAWVEQPYEPSVVTLWLDDAQRAAYDAVEFAAPRLAFTVERAAGLGIAQGNALVLTLSRTESEQAIGGQRPSELGVRRQWRSETELTTISGTVTLDANTGVWLQANLDVHYALQGADERRLAGSLRLRATAEPGAPRAVDAPGDPVPMPRLPRYGVEEQALLEGL